MVDPNVPLEEWRKRIPTEIWPRIESILASDETLVWCGAPDARGMAIRSAVGPGCALILSVIAACILFGLESLLAWLVIRTLFVAILFWIAVIGSVVALGFLIAAPASAWWRARRTAYAITNRRALIVLPEKILSYPATEMQTPIILRLPDGRGDILFERKVVETDIRNEDGVLTSSQKAEHVVGFLELANVDEPKQALEWLLGHELQAEAVTSVPADYHHPL